MKTINLKDYYPYYTQDMFLEVSDELAAIFDGFDKAEAAYERKKFRYKAHYSLDRNDGIEHNILFVSLTPYEIYECKLPSRSTRQLPPCRTSRQSVSTLQNTVYSVVYLCGERATVRSNGCVYRSDYTIIMATPIMSLCLYSHISFVLTHKG